MIAFQILTQMCKIYIHVIGGRTIFQTTFFFNLGDIPCSLVISALLVILLIPVVILHVFLNLGNKVLVLQKVHLCELVLSLLL